MSKVSILGLLVALVVATISGCGGDESNTVIGPDPNRVDWVPPEDPADKTPVE